MITNRYETFKHVEIPVCCTRMPEIMDSHVGEPGQVPDGPPVVMEAREAGARSLSCDHPRVIRLPGYGVQHPEYGLRQRRHPGTRLGRREGRHKLIHLLR